jgi:hypothetical protein
MRGIGAGFFLAASVSIRHIRAHPSFLQIYFTAAAQSSQRKFSVAWRSELRFIFGVLCALRVSAVHLCTEVKRVFHHSGTAFTGFNPVQQVRPL